MVTQSNIHFFTNWAKERLDEMDATVASLEGKAAEVQADVRDKAKKVLADVRKQRDDFRDTMKEQSEANEAAWIQAKAKLEADWRLFEAEVKKYVESFGKQIEHQQATLGGRITPARTGRPTNWKTSGSHIGSRSWQRRLQS
jgi:Zn-dependent M32 family carboxypeptidase